VVAVLVAVVVCDVESWHVYAKSTSSCSVVVCLNAHSFRRVSHPQFPVQPLTQITFEQRRADSNLPVETVNVPVDVPVVVAVDAAVLVNVVIGVDVNVDVTVLVWVLVAVLVCDVVVVGVVLGVVPVVVAVEVAVDVAQALQAAGQVSDTTKLRLSAHVTSLLL